MPYDRDKIVASVNPTGFFGHPRGLFALFFTEFWERFSYYGMRAILVYYMYYELSQGGLGLPEDTALAIMSIYGSLVYMSGIIGGWLADRILGLNNSILVGGILIMLGHICLAIPGSLVLFFSSMVLIVIGTGLLKPNISSVVGELYSESDRRRDSGFSIFYMGINLGGFLAPLITGTIGFKYNFHLGFAVAAVGMLVGLIVFLFLKNRDLGLAGSMVASPLSPEEKRSTAKYILLGVVLLAIVVMITIYTGILTLESFIVLVGILGFLLPTLYFFIMYRSPKTTAIERSRIIAYIPLFIASVLFWSIQEQGATILALFADKRTHLEIYGYTLSPALFQSLNPLFIIVLAPVFAWMWLKLGNRQPSIPVKFSLGLLFAGLSFLVILLPVIWNTGGSLIHPIWLVLSYFIIVIGELCLSPVGLSATTKLAPSAFAAQTMSLWFLSNAAAQGLNAQLVKYYSAENELIYFGTFGIAAIVLSLVLFAISPATLRAMKGLQ